MFGLFTAIVVCAAVIAGVLLLQRGGIPTIHIKHELIQAPTEIPAPYPDVLQSVKDLSDDEQDSNAKKQNMFTDLAALVNNFLEGDTSDGN